MKRLLFATVLLASSAAAADRQQALRRGMDFLVDLARNPKIFADFGHDLLWCFYSISATSADPELSARARAAGVERAREFRRLYPSLPADAGPDTIAWYLFGSYAADQLGVRDDRLKQQIRRAAPRFSAREYLDFDAYREPPPDDVPDECPKCGHREKRGATRCTRDGAILAMQSPHVTWYQALITAYTGDKYGVKLGATFRDVYRWASAMRPYTPVKGNDDFYGKAYAATHVIYTLNDYSKYRVDPRCLPEEYRFLNSSALEPIRLNDPEVMGEFLDSLRAFGMDRQDELIRRGTEFLLRSQNADGSWGDTTDPDPYNRYHPTWTAIDGLRDYRWTKTICPAP